MGGHSCPRAAEHSLRSVFFRLSVRKFSPHDTKPDPEIAALLVLPFGGNVCHGDTPVLWRRSVEPSLREIAVKSAAEDSLCPVPSPLAVRMKKAHACRRCRASCTVQHGMVLCATFAWADLYSSAWCRSKKTASSCVP